MWSWCFLHIAGLPTHSLWKLMCIERTILHFLWLFQWNLCQRSTSVSYSLYLQPVSSISLLFNAWMINSKDVGLISQKVLPCSWNHILLFLSPDTPVLNAYCSRYSSLLANATSLICLSSNSSNNLNIATVNKEKTKQKCLVVENKLMISKTTKKMSIWHGGKA